MSKEETGMWWSTRVVKRF